MIVYLFTSAGTTPFDYFTRLADAFIDGKFYITENPPWLSELIPVEEQKFYIPYAPMPAILSMPFRFVFGQLFEQQYLAHILGVGITIFTILTAWGVKKSKALLIWIGLLTSFGNIMWYMSSTGSSWYLGQITSAFFLTVAIYESLNKKRPFIIGLLLGGAFLSRLHVILAFPFFLYQLFDRKNWFKNYFYFGFGLLPYFAFNFYYNFVRFGTIFDKGYILIPNVLDEPWFSKGLFHLSYIPNHLKIIFQSLPKFSNEFPYITPSWAGLSIWITTPAFIYALFANLKEKYLRFAWISIFLIMLVVFSHGTTGFAQFGYRFAVDFYPFLFLLIIKALENRKLMWHHWLLLLLSIGVNLWGVLWINKFGWVSF